MRVLIAGYDEDRAGHIGSVLASTAHGYAIAPVATEALADVRTGNYSIIFCNGENADVASADFFSRARGLSGGRAIYLILTVERAAVPGALTGRTFGPDDLLVVPFHPEELLARLATAERALALENHEVLVFALARVAESRDRQTGEHLQRIREYCRLLAEELATWDEYRARVDQAFIDLLCLTSPLHDIGKVGIPDRVLMKPGAFTPEEFEIMKRHTTIGDETLAAALLAHPRAYFLTMARLIAATHHERYDGRGYPHGLRGEEIPLCGRITALADVYDALTTRRIYKPALSHEVARRMIVEASGTQFDPDVVTAFTRRESEFERVASAFQATYANGQPSSATEWMASPDTPDEEPANLDAAGTSATLSTR